MINTARSTFQIPIETAQILYFSIKTLSFYLGWACSVGGISLLQPPSHGKVINYLQTQTLSSCTYFSSRAQRSVFEILLPPTSLHLDLFACLLPAKFPMFVLSCYPLPCLYPICYLPLFWNHLLFSYVLIAQECVFTWEISPAWDQALHRKDTLLMKILEMQFFHHGHFLSFNLNFSSLQCLQYQK